MTHGPSIEATRPEGIFAGSSHPRRLFSNGSPSDTLISLGCIRFPLQTHPLDFGPMGDQGVLLWLCGGKSKVSPGEVSSPCPGAVPHVPGLSYGLDPPESRSDNHADASSFARKA